MRPITWVQVMTALIDREGILTCFTFSYFFLNCKYKLTAFLHNITECPYHCFVCSRLHGSDHQESIACFINIFSTYSNSNVAVDDFGDLYLSLT